MISKRLTFMFPFQLKNIFKHSEQEGYNQTFKQKTFKQTFDETNMLHSSKNMFSNKLNKIKEENRFQISLCHAWNTIDRKLRGFEYNIKSAFEDRENCHSILLDFTIEFPNTIIVNRYIEFYDIYKEIVDPTHGMFLNFKHIKLHATPRSESMIKSIIIDLTMIEDFFFPLDIDNLVLKLSLQDIDDNVLRSYKNDIFMSDDHFEESLKYLA